MAELGAEIEKILVANLRKTVPAAVKKLKPSELVDNSSKAMGFKKLKKSGVMPK